MKSLSSQSSPQEGWWARRESVLFGALVLLLLVMGFLTGGRYLSGENLRDILVNASIPAVAAAGMTVLIVSAQIDISIGAIMAVAAVVVATLAQRHLPLPLLLLAAVGSGLALGAVNGVLTAYLKVPSIVATLATVGAIRGLLVWATHGEELPVAAGPTAFGSVQWLGLPSVVWCAALLTLALALFLARTRPGRHHYAVGSNPVSAQLSGLPVSGITFRAFLLLGGLVGLGGFLYACNYSPITPKPQPGFELAVITAVVVGGTDIFGGAGTVLGSTLAALLLSAIGIALTFLKSYVRERFGWELPSEVQPAIQGVLILAAVLYSSLSRRRN